MQHPGQSHNVVIYMCAYIKHDSWSGGCEFDLPNRPFLSPWFHFSCQTYSGMLWADACMIYLATEWHHIKCQKVLHVTGEDLSQLSGNSNDKESHQNIMEVQQEISEPSWYIFERVADAKDLLISATCVIMISRNSVMDVLVTYQMPIVYAILLVKLLFAGSLAHMRKIAYLIQWAYLHKRANACFKKQVSRSGRAVFFLDLVNENIAVQVKTKIYI